MTLCAELQQRCAEDLILMCVEHDVPDTGLLVHEPLPITRAEEGVVDGQDGGGVRVAD